MASKSSAKKTPSKKDGPKAAVARKVPKVVATPTSNGRSVSKPKPAKAKRPAASARATKGDDTFYVVVDKHQLRIASAKPAGGHVATADSFLGAKDKAIDILIERIEWLEQHLWLLKQASDFEDYEARAAGE